VFNDEFALKVDTVIRDKFPFIYDYTFDGIVLLYGGTVRNLLMDLPMHDLDFVILTQYMGQIDDFLHRFKLKYNINAGDGYKVYYNGFTIDLIEKNDLLDVGVYDSDMLFYDIDKRLFISYGAIVSFDKRVITEINCQEKPLYSNKDRLKKIIRFIKFVSKNDKKVKVHQNKLRWNYRIYKLILIKKIKRIFNTVVKKNYKFFYNCKKEIIAILIFGVLVSAISMIIPILTGKLLTGILEKNYQVLFALILGIAIVKLLSLLFSYLASKLYLIVRKKFLFNMSKEILNFIINLEMMEFDEYDKGVFIEKIKNDPNEIVLSLNNIKDVLFKGVINFGSVIYIFCLDCRIGSLLVLFSLIICLLKIIGIIKRRRYRNAYFKSQERYMSVLGEMIAGVHDIKKIDISDNYLKRTIGSFESIDKNEFKGDYYFNFYDKLSLFVQSISFGIIMFYGVFLTQKGLLESSSLVIIFMYESSIFNFLERLGKLVGLISDLNISCDRVFKLLDNKNYVEESFGDKYNDICDGEIEFKNVNFRYKNKKEYVLKKCNFKILNDEFVAVVGKSGVGKTTILNLISRLYTVDSGEIKIDGININEYSEIFFRDNISVVTQNPYLFDMSIKDNLKLVKKNITDNEIISVCKMVCLDEFIETLPKKYDTVIGEGGTKLSGGQKQRLGIARALIKNTKIILLDEITSALDNENASVIKKVIKNIRKERTIIIVTHNLALVKDCARILVLDDGKIVGDGTHKELIKRNDIYKRLYKNK